MSRKDEHPDINAEQVRPGRGHNLLVPPRLHDRIDHVAIVDLRAYRRNARAHPKKQIRKLCDGIATFGFLQPILIDEDGNVITGHARLMAARQLGYAEVPVIRITHLSPAEIRAFRIGDNRIAELAEWNDENLAREFQDLLEIDFDVELTGFEAPEIDMRIEALDGPVGPLPADIIPPVEQDRSPVTVPGDLWQLDDQRLFCGDAREDAAYEAVLGGELAQMVITDAPYNFRIDGNAVGLGAIRHGEFMVASGEMSDAEFTAFIADFVQHLVRFSVDGSVHYLFMNWRNLQLLQTVCARYYPEQLNLCVWAKTNGGMGSLYRSQHELVAVYRNGTAPHINNVRLGKYGRNRTNVWRYEGVNTLNPDRRKDLALHPTVKPVALIADAIRDCSHRGGIILDPFMGSGTAIIAAEQTGRRCRGIELDPVYVDVAIRRWEQFTGGTARHAATGLTFTETETVRRSPVPLLPPPNASHGEEA